MSDPKHNPTAFLDSLKRVENEAKTEVLNELLAFLTEHEKEITPKFIVQNFIRKQQEQIKGK